MTAVLRPRQEPFKPHAIKVAEAARARVMNGVPKITDPDELEAARTAEIHQWRDHVVDLHRVFSVAEAMFLLLEHNNEALLRVALEIVCCASSQKVLWWNIGWYSDEKRRAQFREIVNGFLGKCMAYMNVEAPDTSAQDEEARHQAETLQQLREQNDKAEASRKAMEHTKGLLEIQIRDLQTALAEATAREKELQKANQSLQSELRQSVHSCNQSSEADKALADQLAELQSKLAKSEEQKLSAMEKMKKMEAHAKKLEDEVAVARKGDAEQVAQAKVVEAEKKLSAEQARANAAEKRVQESEKEIAALKDALRKAEAAAKTKKPVAATQAVVQEVEADPEVVRNLQESLQEQKKIAAEYLAELEPFKQALMNPSGLSEGGTADDMNTNAGKHSSSGADDQKTNAGKHSSSGECEETPSLQGVVRKRLTLASHRSDFIAEIKRLQDLAKKPPETVVVERVVERVVTVESPSQKKSQEVENVPLDTPCQTKSKQKEPDEEPPPPPKKKQVEGIPQEEYEAKCRELEKAQAKNASLRTKLKEITEERDQLQERSDKMLKMLHQLKEQLKRVTAIAHKRGYGNIVDAILDEAHVTQTLESPEFSIYDRLYEDAKRRQEKHRQWEESRIGIQPKLPGARKLVLQTNLGLNVPTTATQHRASEPNVMAPTGSFTPVGSFSTQHRSSAPDVTNHEAWGPHQATGQTIPSMFPREAPNMHQSEGSVGMWTSEGSGVYSLNLSRPGSSQSNLALRQRPSSSPSNNKRSQQTSFAATWPPQLGDINGELTVSPGLNISGFSVGSGTPVGMSSEPLDMWTSAPEPIARYEKSFEFQKGLLQPSFSMGRTASAPSLRGPRSSPRHGVSAMSLDVQGSPGRSLSPAGVRKLHESRSAVRSEDALLPFGVHGERIPGAMRGFKLMRRHGKVVNSYSLNKTSPKSVGEDLFCC